MKSLTCREVGQKATGLKEGEPGYPQGDTAFLFPAIYRVSLFILRIVVSRIFVTRDMAN
jgi:hypothetical protein